MLPCSPVLCLSYAQSCPARQARRAMSKEMLTQVHAAAQLAAHVLTASVPSVVLWTLPRHPATFSHLTRSLTSSPSTVSLVARLQCWCSQVIIRLRPAAGASKAAVRCRCCTAHPRRQSQELYRRPGRQPLHARWASSHGARGAVHAVHAVGLGSRSAGTAERSGGYTRWCASLSSKLRCSLLLGDSTSSAVPWPPLRAGRRRPLSLSHASPLLGGVGESSSVNLPSTRAVKRLGQRSPSAGGAETCPAWSFSCMAGTCRQARCGGAWGSPPA